MGYTVNLTGNKNSKDGSILGKINDFRQEMALHESEGLNNYKKHPHLSACARTSIVHNRHTGKDIETVMFGSNSYLGATIFSEAIEQSIEATRRFGIGSGGVPLLTGTTCYHNRLEKIIADKTGFEDSILFSSGYTANLGAISGLVRPDNLVIHDKLMSTSHFSD